MSKDNIDNLGNSRKTSDVLLSLEEKILTLTKSMSAHDMNIKLILDRLNKLLAQESKSVKPIEEPKVYSITPSVDISQTPLIPRKKNPGVLVQTTQITDEFEEKKSPPPTSAAPKIVPPSKKQAKSNDNQIVSKIPVGQKVVDQNGKDIFMADVTISDLENKDAVVKAKTSAIGKWQTYLPIGKYSVKIIKITNSDTLDKIEYTHIFEVSNNIKSLLLPNATMNR